jgi:murein L,D-transpeptidase YafK
MTACRHAIRQLLLLVLLAAGNAVAADVHVRVDTTAGTLAVMRGDEVVRMFDDIAIGRYGATDAKQRGDNRTPLGYFTIGWISAQSRYHRFLGLNYPDLETASRAFFKGLISKEEWLEIRRASKAGRRPPQNTALGGLIGIHGVGEGDLAVHREYNWTNGCVALTNEEIDQLLEWVEVGTPVEIR